MKRIKKIASAILAGALALSMVACGSESSSVADESSSSASTSTDTSSTAETGSTELAAGVQEIVDRGVLRVGVKTDVIGFGYLDPLTNEYSGMEVDLAKMLADQLGVEVEYTPVTVVTRGQLLDSGDLDCDLATFTITEERRQSWDFSTPYYTDHVSVLVQNDSGIKTLADLQGKTVGVSTSSTSAAKLVEAMIDAGIIPADSYDSETFDPATWTEGVSFRQYDDYPAISTALSAGQVDAFCVDKSILAYYASADRSYIEEEFAPQEYGIVTKKGSDFSAYCDQFVKDREADGTIDELIAKYNLG